MGQPLFFTLQGGTVLFFNNEVPFAGSGRKIRLTWIIAYQFLLY